jgi:hypothetical protein
VFNQESIESDPIDFDFLSLISYFCGVRFVHGVELMHCCNRGTNNRVLMDYSRSSIEF